MSNGADTAGARPVLSAVNVQPVPVVSTKRPPKLTSPSRAATEAVLADVSAAPHEPGVIFTDTVADEVVAEPESVTMTTVGSGRSRFALVRIVGDAVKRSVEATPGPGGVVNVNDGFTSFGAPAVATVTTTVPAVSDVSFVTASPFASVTTLVSVNLPGAAAANVTVAPGCTSPALLFTVAVNVMASLPLARAVLLLVFTDNTDVEPPHADNARTVKTRKRMNARVSRRVARLNSLAKHAEGWNVGRLE